ncbi:isochorismate synthase [Gandjariella thermophila]|uniref:isochorismate synthase n=1 Tax=Gandjariella thermophila TaxID=1931992 RepID=A0A4D4J2U7_9PSEU|nr:isochorismate synthase [Gandjariella thermophila]
MRTREVSCPVELLDLLPGPDDALAWVSGGEGLVGWGEAARVEASGPDRFAELDRWWRRFASEFDVQDDVRRPGTGPVAFTSIAFADEPGRSVLVVPRVVVGQRDGVTWITEIGGPGDGAAQVPMQRVRPVRRPTVDRYTAGQLPVVGYRDAVHKAVHRMRTGELDKVVLAHDLLAVTDGPVDARFLLRRLADRYPNCWAYAVDGLVGATPELLLRRTGRRVSSRVLAGTTWPRPGVDADELAAGLLGSAKDREEHRFAVRSLAATLSPYCAELRVPEAPTVMRLPNVLHLASEVHGRLLDGTPLLRLAEAVHPTAAVGGFPTAAAVRLIAELEPMDRGRYTGPVGWLDAEGGGELGIALRCAELGDGAVRLFAGCGIVADSDPDSEVREAAAKLVPMREALEDGTTLG